MNQAVFYDVTPNKIEETKIVKKNEDKRIEMNALRLKTHVFLFVCLSILFWSFLSLSFSFLLVKDDTSSVLLHFIQYFSSVLSLNSKVSRLQRYHYFSIFNKKKRKRK